MRRSGGTRRPTTPSTTPKLAPLKPEPDEQPRRRRRARGRWSSTPSARAPARSTSPPQRDHARRRRSGRRSSPVNGCARPHTRFCSAIAAENVSRPQPSAEHIGCRNRPKPWRVPMREHQDRARRRRGRSRRSGQASRLSSSGDGSVRARLGSAFPLAARAGSNGRSYSPRGSRPRATRRPLVRIDRFSTPARLIDSPRSSGCPRHERTNPRARYPGRAPSPRLTGRRHLMARPGAPSPGDPPPATRWLTFVTQLPTDDPAGRMKVFRTLETLGLRAAARRRLPAARVGREPPRTGQARPRT